MTQGGGLLQLVAVGKQDVFLTGNPQITWFKYVYRRYTTFAVESQRMYFEGSPDFGQRISCTVPRIGDLLGAIFLVVTLPKLYLDDGTTTSGGQEVGYVNSIGHALIQEISIDIGEQQVDRQTGEWMQIWSDLTVDSSQRMGFQNMIGEIDGYPYVTQNGPGTIYIPLRFWFNKNPGLYLPLLALQYHAVRINVTVAPLQNLFYSTQLYTNCNLKVKPARITSMQLWGDYVYLDTEERRRFVSAPLEYLIEQVQYTPYLSIAAQAVSGSFRLDFNHPLKEMIWVLQRNAMMARHEWFNWSSIGAAEAGPEANDLIVDALIQLDGQDRFDKREAAYFRLIQPYQYHTNIPAGKFIYVYSFALRPEDIQPSGSLNASRFNSIVLQLTPNNDKSTMPTGGRGDLSSRVYATNYNVLRVIDGFGGLLFSV
jgi:hypothetical protein